MGRPDHVAVGNLKLTDSENRLSKERGWKPYASLGIGMLIIFSSLAVITLSSSGDNPHPLKARILYTTHDPIYIASDFDWSVSGFPGDGSEGNPYVISGYDIAGVGTNAITITSTTVHFVIDDCYLHGDGYGIYLYNAENSTLTNNNCSMNAQDGIWANSDSKDLRLNASGNTVSNNGGYGIEAYAWPWNVTAVIADCNVSGNQYDGIYLEGGNNLNATIVRTNVTLNGYYGLELWSDNWDINALFQDCNVSGNWDNGMYIDASNSLNLTLAGVDVTWNYGSGIEAYSEYWNLSADVDECNLSYNGWTGLYLYSQGGLALTMDDTDSSWNAQSGGWSAGLEMEAYGGDFVASLSDCNLSYNGNEGVFARGSYNVNLTLVNCSVTWNDQSYGWSCGVEAYAYDGDLNLTTMSSTISDHADQGMYMEASANLYLNMDSTSVVRNRDGDYGGYGIEGYAYNYDIFVKMHGCNVSENYDDGVYLDAWNYVDLNLTNSIFGGNDGYGIETSNYEGGTNAVLSGCSFVNNYFSGVYLNSAYELYLSMIGCDASWNGLSGSWYGYGVEAYCGDFTEAVIDGCRMNGNYLDGLYLSNLEYSTVTNNMCIGNGGIGIDLSGFDYGTVSNNRCMLNEQVGIGVYYSTDSEISHNICTNNSADGIDVMWSSGCPVSWNLLADNLGYGVGLSSDSGCTVWNNTFIFNHGSTTVWDAGAVQGYDDGSNVWNVDGKPHGWGNFWSDWTTPDDDGDGIVDISYEIDGVVLAEDLYPLTQPEYRLPKTVYGIVRDDGWNPLPVAGVTVMMKDGAAVISTKAAVSDSSGLYAVTFGWEDWNVGYTIEVIATYGSLQTSNSTVSDVNTTQQVDVMFEYEIPQFGSLVGLLLAGLFVGAVGAILLVRRKGPRQPR